jgi:hypothetical protein
LICDRPELPVEVSKVAVTVVSAVRVMVQSAVPVHEPDHPVNDDPVAAMALSVTCVPLVNCALHWPGQLIAAGLLVTVPDPVPAG